MSWQRNGLLLVLLAYMIGPNPSLGGAQIGDALLAIYVLAYLASSRVSVRLSLVGFFLFPSFVIAVSLAGKVLSGFAVGSDEINNVLKTASLGVLGLVGASFGAGAAAEQNDALPQRMCQLAVVGVLFAGTLGVVQYVRPSLFADLARGLYEKPLITNVSNLQQAALTNRVSSIFSWANAFGMFVVFGMAVALVNARHVPRWAMVAVMVAGGVGVLLANSRISMLLLGLAAVYAAILNGRWRLLVITVGAVAIFVALVPADALLGPGNVSRLEELGNFVRTGTLPRTLAMRLAVLGYLPGRLASSDYLYFGFPMAVYQRTVFLSADNQYLGFFLKYGLCAILLIGWQWFYAVMAAVRVRRARQGAAQKSYLHALVLLNVIVAVGALSQDTLFLERWREFFFSFSGVVLGMAFATEVQTEADVRVTTAVG